ncbi:hypothetical protein CRUP_022940 [Coryphaenoides rupestris]|nr:hypothetical protein CRUP_022940 [Coryphaenoides rupestris]
MNGLSLSELCCLFCCPPCPGRIAAKLAFLPPEPTYALLPDPEAAAAGVGGLPSPGAPGGLGLRSRSGAAVGGAGAGLEGKWKLHLMDRADFQYTQRELDTTEVFVTRSAKGNKVGCMYIRCAPTASTGKPSEKNLYADIDAAWHALRTRYGISPENIILYGQSIGTVPTVDLASRYDIEKVSKITSPVLIIHGTEDEVIDFSHGLALFERCPKAVEPLWVEGAGHNDIELYSQYLERLRRFINQDLAAP